MTVTAAGPYELPAESCTVGGGGECVSLAVPWGAQQREGAWARPSRCVVGRTGDAPWVMAGAATLFASRLDGLVGP